ncbi:MAG TPA: hypothetical protein VN540_01800, partial [Clostridia bacterium]|nr:hypothetical protein [Clostridia bacterium]
MRRILLVFCALLLALLIPACNLAPKVETSAPVDVTTVPTATIAPSPSSPPPTLAPTPEPTAGDGRVQLAEGFYYIELNDEIKARITGLSYPEEDSDIAIHYDDLR